MPVWRDVAYVIAFGLLNVNMTTCRSNAEDAGSQSQAEKVPIVELSGVDTTSLTDREKENWSRYVTEMLAPCPDQPVSVAQCVKESRACAACLPAAKYLLKQVRLGKTAEQAEQAYKGRFDPDQVKSIDLADSPFKGPQDAPVTLVEWADFECPFCGFAAPLIDKLTERFPRRLRVVFKHYPLPAHQNAKLAALAAVAAHKQGKFWQMHKLLFANQQALNEADLMKYAKQIGLDVKQFTEDFKSIAAEKIIERDQKAANKVGLQGTPTIYINGREFAPGSFNEFEKDLQAWIELELKLQGGSVKPAAMDKSVKDPAVVPSSSAATAASTPPPVAPAPSASAK